MQAVIDELAQVFVNHPGESFYVREAGVLISGPEMGFTSGGAVPQYGNSPVPDW